MKAGARKNRLLPPLPVVVNVEWSLVMEMWPLPSHSSDWQPPPFCLFTAGHFTSAVWGIFSFSKGPTFKECALSLPLFPWGGGRELRGGGPTLGGPKGHRHFVGSVSGRQRRRRRRRKNLFLLTRFFFLSWRLHQSFLCLFCVLFPSCCLPPSCLEGKIDFFFPFRKWRAKNNLICSSNTRRRRMFFPWTDDKQKRAHCCKVLPQTAAQLRFPNFYVFFFPFRFFQSRGGAAWCAVRSNPRKWKSGQGGVVL